MINPSAQPFRFRRAETRLSQRYAAELGCVSKRSIQTKNCAKHRAATWAVGETRINVTLEKAERATGWQPQAW
jgi:hypothetical protein